jgi:hypothetical protein
MDGIIYLLLLLALYWLPTVIAVRRGHHNYWPITVVNLFTGWTGIGWVVALVWSVTAVRRAA